MHSDYQLKGINIELTNCCPLHCPQCYCTLEGGKHIPLAVAKERLKEAADLGVTHVELSGGETLCYPHLYELIVAAREYGIAPNIAISGWHFDDIVLDNLITAGIDTICVSINGPTRESNALTRDGFDYAIQALETLERRCFDNVMINWVMHRSSVVFLPQMIKLAKKYKIPAILIIEPKPSFASELDSYPTADQMHYVASLVKKPKDGVELIVQHCFSPLLALSSENVLWGNTNRSIYKGCTAGLCSCSVNVDGDFTPCRHLEYPEQWDTLHDYWYLSSKLREIRAHTNQDSLSCTGCSLSAYCRPCIAKKYLSRFSACPLMDYVRN